MMSLWWKRQTAQGNVVFSISGLMIAAYVLLMLIAIVMAVILL